MGKFSRNKLKYSVNEQFFDIWTSQMAYILGFTYADGNIHRSSLSWEIQLGDKNILKKFNIALNSTYPIKTQRQSSCRLRINNQVLINAAVKRGLLPKKNIRNTLPEIPDQLMGHFVRGYLDGDGWIVLRKGRVELDVGFSNGNGKFLAVINHILEKFLKIEPATVRKKVKITKNKITSTSYTIEYYSSNAWLIAQWLYENLNKDDLYLDRKYQKYIRAKKLYLYLKSGTKKVRVVQKRLGKPIKEILRELYENKGYDGVQIAQFLDIHPSSAYRWLEQTGLKIPIHRN